MQIEDTGADDGQFPQSTGSVLAPAGRRNGDLPAKGGFAAIVAAVTRERISSLSASEINRHVEFLIQNPGRIHSEIDGHALAILRNRLQRDLTDEERRDYRRLFAEALRKTNGR